MQVTQAGNTGNGCIYSLGTDTSLNIPTGQTIDSDGGSNNVPVTAPGGCPWAVASDVNWVTLTTTNYTGNATVPFIVLTNSTSNTRIGHLILAGQTYTVTQN